MPEMSPIGTVAAFKSKPLTQTQAGRYSTIAGVAIRRLAVDPFTADVD